MGKPFKRTITIPSVENKASVNMKLAAGSLFLLIIMILAFSPLNTEVQTIATVETATSIEVLLGVLFPYVMVFLILVLGGVIAYDVVMKK